MSKPRTDSPPSAPTWPDCMSIATAASRKDVHPRTVRRWFAHGLPFVQPIPHGKILIRLADLDAWLESRRVVKPFLDTVVNTCVEEVMQSFTQRGRR